MFPRWKVLIWGERNHNCQLLVMVPIYQYDFGISVPLLEKDGNKRPTHKFEGCN